MESPPADLPVDKHVRPKEYKDEIVGFAPTEHTKKRAEQSTVRGYLEAHGKGHLLEGKVIEDPFLESHHADEIGNKIDLENTREALDELATEPITKPDNLDKPKLAASALNHDPIKKPDTEVKQAGFDKETGLAVVLSILGTALFQKFRKPRIGELELEYENMDKNEPWKIGKQVKIKVKDVGSKVKGSRFFVTGLPKGLGFDESTNTIQGAPEVSGRFEINVVRAMPKTVIANVTHPEEIKPDGTVIAAYTEKGEKIVAGRILATGKAMSKEIEPQKFCYPSQLILMAGESKEIVPDSNLSNPHIEVDVSSLPLPPWLTLNQDTGALEINPPMTVSGKQGPYKLNIYDGGTAIMAVDLEFNVKLPELKIEWDVSKDLDEAAFEVGEEVNMAIDIKQGDNGNVELTVSHEEFLGLKWNKTARRIRGTITKPGSHWVTVTATRNADGAKVQKKYLFAVSKSGK